MRLWLSALIFDLQGFGAEQERPPLARPRPREEAASSHPSPEDVWNQ